MARKYHKVSSNIVCYAFRYCLGRQTGAVGDCVNTLIRVWKDLHQTDRDQIVREIKQAIARGDAGSSCDINEWNKVLVLEPEDRRPRYPND